MKYPTLCLLLCTAILTSCAVRVDSIKEDVVEELEKDIGYLLLGIETNATLKSVDIFGADNIRLTHKDLRPDSEFILIDLEAGDYDIRNMRFNSFVKAELTDGFWNFTIVPGQISYIGHLEVDNKAFWAFAFNSSFELTNRSTEALLFMQERFPNILEHHTLRYAGPGKDRFLQWFQGLDETQQAKQEETAHD